MKRVLVLIAVFFVTMLVCKSQRADILIEYSDSSAVDIDTLYVYGFGNISSRIFLDELSAHLQKELSSKSVYLSYSYQGEQLDSAKFYELAKADAPALFIIDKNFSNFKVVRVRRSYRVGDFFNQPGNSVNVFKTKYGFKGYFAIVMSGADYVSRYGEMIVETNNVRNHFFGEKVAKRLLKSLNVLK